MSQSKLLTRYLFFVLFSFSWLLVDINYIAIAQTENFKPLAIPQNDPLLPSNNLQRELSPLEKKRVRSEIATLEIQAKQKLEQGQQKQAFKLWFRQLRLYRAISQREEIIALGRVGEIAWQANLKEELKVISQRLNDVYQKLNLQNELAKELLNALGTSYQQIRSLDNAIAVYHDLLIQAHQVNNFQLEQKYLEVLGELYLNKFNYIQAAAIYEELLNTAKKITNQENLDLYLSKLVEIYSYTKQTRQAIIVKKQLIEHYLSQNNNEQIGKLTISLGDDYQSLGEAKLAIVSYQEASVLTESLQQIALTSEALEKLGNIYQKQKQYFLAIKTFQKLLDIERQTNDTYGLMKVYEQLGKVYLITENYEKALNAFSNGLKIAQSLNNRVSYFTDLVDRVEKKLGNSLETEIKK